MIRVHELPIDEKGNTVTVTDAACDWCGAGARLKGDHSDFKAFEEELNWRQVETAAGSKKPTREHCSNRCRYEWLKAETSGFRPEYDG